MEARERLEADSSWQESLLGNSYHSKLPLCKSVVVGVTAVCGHKCWQLSLNLKSVSHRPRYYWGTMNKTVDEALYHLDVPGKDETNQMRVV